VIGLPTEGVEILERSVPGMGLLRFENHPAGTWFTQAGDPAKRARRRYLLNDVELDSVSSVVGTMDKPALLRWYEEQGLTGGARAMRDGVLNGTPEGEWADLCRLHGYGPTSAAGTAAGRGIAIHAAFESMARTGEPPVFEDYPVEWHAWLRGAVRAWLALDPEPTEFEQIVCRQTGRFGLASNWAGWAGRFDLYARCHGQRTLLDYKTGRGRIFDAAHYQTRGYALCFEPCELEPPERILLVGVDDEGGFQLVDCEASEEDWLVLCDVYCGRKRINAGMAAQRKVAKQAANGGENT
jgi:hypothetical protein